MQSTEFDDPTPTTLKELSSANWAIGAGCSCDNSQVKLTRLVPIPFWIYLLNAQGKEKKAQTANLTNACPFPCSNRLPAND
jgi:hypothetical protein